MIEQAYMARALQLAERGRYSTRPNPRVGCVLVKDGRVLAEGWHQKAGQGHAEVEALAQAAESVAGATAYVTLEPCNHTGKTPPCTEQLIAAGISEVVCAMQDPNPLVAGQGFARLRAAGVKVTQGVMELQARALNPGFIKRMEQGVPFVRCKMAMSLDGRTAMASGESQWITGPDARADVQSLRASSCAILTGIGTLLADDPSLTVRAEELRLKQAAQICAQQPLRVVLDSGFRMPVTAKLLAQPGPVLWVGADMNAAPQPPQAEVALVQLPVTEAGLDLHALLSLLGKRQCNEVLIEAGATLAGAFLQQGLVDELVLYMAPKLLGDAARGLFHLPGLDRMAQQVKIEIKDVRNVGADLRINAIVAAQS